MSSPISPLTERIARIRQLGGQVVDAMSHPGQAIHDMFSPPQPNHQQAIDQMNRGLNDQRVQDANQSFQQPNLSTMKKPLGK